MSLTTTTEPYLPGSIPFSQYLEQLEFIFEHNNVEEAKHKTSFLAVCGQEVYSEVKKLFPGKDLKALTYKEITDELRKRYDKNDSEVINSYKFWTRRQGRNEKAEDFVLAVKVLAEKCDFDGFKDRAIRDVLVIGVFDRNLQKRLFDEDGLTAAKAEKLILNQELATARSKILNNDDDKQVSVVARLGRRPERRDQRFRSRSRSMDRTRSGDNRRENKNRSFSRSRSRSRYNNNNYNNNYNNNRYLRNGKPVYFCTFCKRNGHTRKFCRKLNDKGKTAVKFLDSPQNVSNTTSSLFKRLKIDMPSDTDDDDDMPCMMIASVNKLNGPCYVEVTVERRRLTMEVDCGSAETVISEELFERNFGNTEIKTCNKKLAVIDGKRLKVIGKAEVNVKLEGVTQNLTLVILKCGMDFIPLMGRTWLDVFYPGWRNTFVKPKLSAERVNTVKEEPVVSDIKSKFPNVFDKDFSSPIIGFEGDLILKEDRPIFRKAYEVPLRLRQKVLDYLAELERNGIITPIEASEWASPVVIIIKKDQGIRLVIDCKVTINKVIIPNTYPLPLAQEIFSALSGSKVYCSLDLAGAYTQLLLSSRSRMFMVINTIKGLYIYNRLPQGASSSASIFQKVMDTILQGIPNVRCYLDDVLISGKDYNDCKSKLYLVLERLAKANIKVNFKKCKFFVSRLPYLGHVLTDQGLLPCPDKVETIREAKAPRNVSELKAFLGLITYYSKFIPNMSSRIHCLYGLLRKNVKFIWSTECEKVFNDCKQFLLKPKLLEFFDPVKPIVVVTDACNYGLGGVIAHVVNGEERPISFTSYSLNEAQKKYPILHLEALAVVTTVKKFHKFLYGMQFTIYTDHKPLIGIFGKEGKIPLSVTRLQRYVTELSVYDYEMIYRPASKLANADFCSRFPLQQQIPKEMDLDFVKSLNFTNDFPLNYKQVAQATKSDDFLQRIVKYLQVGWPERIDRKLLDIYSHYQELEIVDGCILFQDRVVIPEVMKKQVLGMLHINHSGMNKIKQLARRTVYWFGMNSDIEDHVKSCRICNETTAVTKRAPYSKWIPTNKPFSRIHADFFYFDKKVFLVIIDSFTKWIELEYMRLGTDTRKVIKVFLSIFARYGLPDVLVTDGGPPFNAEAFVTFFEKQGVSVLKSPPYHPESNGQAERTVRLVKDVFKKFMLDPGIKKMDTDEQISVFLFNYRNICLNDDKKFPSERMLSYKPKTVLDLINPKSNFKNNQNRQHDDSETTNRGMENNTFEATTLKNGDLVYYKNMNKTDIRRYLPATFLKQISSNIFQLSLGGRVISAHKRQIKILPNSRRKTRQNFVFRGVSPEAAQQHKSNKRKREDLEQSSDYDSDFFGFAADSYIFEGEEDDAEQHDLATRTTSQERRAVSQQRSPPNTVMDDPEPMDQDEELDPEPDTLRRSKRRTKRRRKAEFHYY